MENSHDGGRLKAFVQGSAILVASNIVLKAINFFLLPLYTKYLTPEMLGISDMVTMLTGLLLPLLVMGMDSAYSAFYYDQEPGRERCVFNTSAAFLLGVSLIPLVGCLFARPLAQLLFGGAEYALAIALALCSVSINLWFMPFSLELRLQNRMALFGTINVTASLLMVGLNILFVSVIQVGAYALIVSSAIVQLCQYILYRLLSHERYARVYFDRGLLKKMLRYALPLLPTSIVMWVLTLSDRYVLLYSCGEAEVGLYGIGSRFVTLLNVIISGVTMAYTTFAFGSKNEEGTKENYAKILNVLYLFLAAACFTISLFGKEIITLMADSTYQTAYLSLRDMMFAQLIYGLSTITSYGIYFEKKSKYAFFSAAAAAAVNLGLNIWLIPQYGFEAAAATTLVGYIILFSMNYIAAQKLYPCPFGIKRIGISCIALYVVALLGESRSLTVKVGVWLACAAIVLFLFRDVLRELKKGVTMMIRSGRKEREG
jgi:O-antigen/teichoic acid export membrane protein